MCRASSVYVARRGQLLDNQAQIQEVLKVAAFQVAFVLVAVAIWYGLAYLPVEWMPTLVATCITVVPTIMSVYTYKRCVPFLDELKRDLLLLLRQMCAHVARSDVRTSSANWVHMVWTHLSVCSSPCCAAPFQNLLWCL